MNLQNISGVPEGYLPFLLKDIALKATKIQIFVSLNNDQAFLLEAQIKALDQAAPVLCLPGWDCLPYDRVGPSQKVTHKRIDTFLRLQDFKGLLLVSSTAFIQKVPESSYYQNKTICFRTGETYARSKIIETLVSLGYRRTETVYERGEFSVRGSLIDIFADNAPLRIDFFGDEIETILPFEIDSQTTVSSESLKQFTLKPSTEILLDEEAIRSFRTKYRSLTNNQDELYQAISRGSAFQGSEHWNPLFLEHDFVPIQSYPNMENVIYADYRVCDSLQDQGNLIEDYYNARLKDYPFTPLPPSIFYTSPGDTNFLTVSPFASPDTLDFKGRFLSDFPLRKGNADFIEDVVAYIETNVKTKPVYLACPTYGLRSRVMDLLHHHGFVGELEFYTMPMDRGFSVDDFMVISDQDILGTRERIRQIQKKKSNRFFDELAQIEPNDLLVHKDHGIGRYLGLETLTVGNMPHDCLVLEYEGGDKLFIPVENMELLSRYGSGSVITQLDRLGTTQWATKKGKVKKRIQLIADYLLKLAAERAEKTGVVLGKIEDKYEDFCSQFPYIETEDQLQAINDVITHLSSGKPMDRLICGDVGFGKTEVALRAAFLAVSNGKQVVILTPTTLLCRQHEQTFKKRFEGYRIEQLSRLVTPSKASAIKKDIAEGKVDILIATHSILKGDVNFKDLGLFIIDEEQHFGVKQKEKLRLKYPDVHSLTLTATPIPRTLQLSLAGVRELSLIATPPLDRLAVRTFVVPEDQLTIKEAIQKECNRGGQIFYVCPHIEDQHKLADMLKTLLPDLRFAILNGQMNPHDLEEAVTQFSNRHYDLLLATNILESGIDMPSVNTIILHHSHLFGLAQLYQLRGRVGRSKVQAYAYFTVPKSKTLTENATKRLEILQSLDTLGAGFTLASHDMDIRGAGNILGEEQSGHIKEVGVELYQQLLQEAILMRKAELHSDTYAEEWSPQINLGAAVLIPEIYVQDLSLRLGLYKRLSKFSEIEEVDAFASEMIDRFGRMPLEVKNLLSTYELKILCKKAHIEKLEVGPKGFLIGFYNNQFPNFQGLLEFIQSKPMQDRTKIRPDHRLFIGFESDDLQNRFLVCKKICTKLLNIAQ